MKIKMIPYDNLYQIKENISNNINSYNLDNNDWIKKEFNGKEPFIDTKFDVPDFDLIISDKPEDDFENVKRVYGGLKNVFSDSIASEERLWVWFTLDKFRAYSNKRWKSEKGWTASGIEERLYFKEKGRRALTRNAMARLFWIGHLTYDEENPDHYKYTEYVCKHQRFIVDFLERNISNSFSLIKPCIDAVEEFEKKHPDKKIDSNQMRELQKYINILGGIYILDCLEYQTLHDKIYSKIEKLEK